MANASSQDHRMRLFLGCFIALIATAFGFAVRAAILETWGQQFGLTEEQKGIIQGVGLYPFAISIILFSLIVDRIGYGVSMVFAFIGHVVSALITIFANSFETLYIGTFIFALSNGIVEAVINPVVATIYSNRKTHWLNILHAGWPGGLVLGGLLSIVVLLSGGALGDSLPGRIWQWQVALVLIPTLVYGLVLAGQKFPVQERVAAGVTYMDMLREFGWGSCYIVSFLLVAGINQILVVAGVPAISMWWVAAIAIVPTILFAIPVKSVGRPMFIFLLLVMFLLATTELGTDSWIADIMQSVLSSEVSGTMFLVYTSAIMFVLRFFAGPIVHRISPLGLLAVCAAVACLGLLWLSWAAGVVMLILAATFYGFGKSFFWPTTLGVVAEQYPKGGALMLNAIAGVGMIAVGTIGNPAIGTVQDSLLVDRLETMAATSEGEQPQIASGILEKAVGEKEGQFFDYRAVLPEERAELGTAERDALTALERQSKQNVLAYVSVLPAIMFLCYLGLIGYFRSKGGYKEQVLTGHSAEDEEFTGGVEGPADK